MRPIKILLALYLIRKSLQMVEFHEEKSTPMDHLVCVNATLKTYLKLYSNIWILSSNSNNPVNSLFKFPFVVITEWDLLRGGLFVGKRVLLIFLEGKADQDFNGLQRFQAIATMDPILMVCVANMICSSEMYVKKIVETMVGKQLRYLAVDEVGKIDIYEYTSLVEGSCGIPQLIRRGHCSDKSIVKKVFHTFPNFHKCPIRVVTWTYQQYSNFCDSDELNKLCGFEGIVVKVVAKHINATPMLLNAQTPNEVRQIVASRNADLGFGGLDTRPFKGISYSNSYTVIQATFIASHSTWVIERLVKEITQPLEVEVWMGIGVVIALMFVLRSLVPYFRIIYPLQLLSIFIGIPVSRQPRGLSTRIYFISFVFFGYLCSQSYLTNLTKVLTTSQQRMIRTIEDLEHSGLPVMGAPGAEDKFKADYPRIYRDYQIQNFSAHYDNVLALLQEKGANSVYYVEELERRITAWKTVEPLNDRLTWYSLAFVAPNTSVILKASDRIFLWVAESGIFKEHGIFMPTTVKSWSGKKHEFTSAGESRTLELHELKRVFLLLVVGLSLSFFVFLIEIFTSFIKKKVEFGRRGEFYPESSRQRHFLRVVDID